MIEDLLFSALGFLVALALAVAIAPALWRRAEYLERKRIEAALPLTREELEGEIGAIRAQSAVAIRRLEVKADALRKKAAADAVEMNVLRDRIRDLEGEVAALQRQIQEKDDVRRGLEARLATHDEEVAEYKTRLEELSRGLAEQTDKVQRLSRLNDELSMIASTQKIDLVARETEIEKLNNTISLLRTQRREADRLAREAKAEKVDRENALQLEKEHADRLQTRIDRLLRDISTRDQILERQQKELAQLGVNSPYPWDEIAEEAHAIAQAVIKGEHDNIPDGGEAMQPREMAELQQRIADLSATHRKRHRKEHEAERMEQLRDEISAIAAEMVRMVAEREGPGSQIDKVLAQPAPEIPGLDPGARPESLAERVQRLRNAS